MINCLLGIFLRLSIKSRRFGTLCQFHLQQVVLKMKLTQCSETSAFNTQTPGKYPEDNLSQRIWPYRKSKFGLQSLKIFTIVTQNLKTLNDIYKFYLCNACLVSPSVRPPASAFNWTNSVQFWPAATRSIDILTL